MYLVWSVRPSRREADEAHPSRRILEQLIELVIHEQEQQIFGCTELASFRLVANCQDLTAEWLYHRPYEVDEGAMPVEHSNPLPLQHGLRGSSLSIWLDTHRHNKVETRSGSQKALHR